MRLSVMALAFCAASASPLLSQAVRVVGIAYDSVSGMPLGSAFITLGGSRSVVADSLGRFTFESVAPGPYRLTMQHDALDSLGLTGIAASVNVGSGLDTVRIATPSPRTMWTRMCGTQAPRDSGFTFGIVRAAATGAVIPSATIVASWIDLQSVGKAGVTQRGWKLETQSRSDGSYVLCGLPANAGTRLSAVRDSTAAAEIDIALSAGSLVQRHDLSLADIHDTTSRGTIRGVIVADGRPVSNVRVQAGGVDEVRSREDGGFILRDVPAGTQQLYIQGLGFSPTTRVVTVTTGDTTSVAITLGRVTLLDSMIVTAATARTRQAAQFADRARLGNGYYRDSLQIGKFATMPGVFNTMASVTLQHKKGTTPSFTVGGCKPEIWLDRTPISEADFALLEPRDLAALEVYRRGQIPNELSAMGVGTKSPGPPWEKCAIVAWTKRTWK